MNRSACRPFAQALSLYAAGCLSDPAERRALAAHLAACPACRAHDAQLRALCAGLIDDAASAAEEISPAQATRLRARVHAAIVATTPSAPAFAPLPGRRAMLATACAAVLCLAAITQWHVPPSDPASLRTAPVLAHRAAKPEPKAALSPPAPLPPPTLWAYQRAAMQSDQALQDLLERHAETVLPPVDNSPTVWSGPNQRFNDL